VTNEEVARRYIRAVAELDRPVEESLRHADWSADWPQSGERVVGSPNFRAIQDLYPGGAPSIRVERVIGMEDRWDVSPSNTIIRVTGSGEFWWAEFRMRYPDGVDYLCVTLFELRDSLVYREIVYWAPAFDAPDWRAAFVERAGDVAIR
jgi:hypothetical protein